MPNAGRGRRRLASVCVQPLEIARSPAQSLSATPESSACWELNEHAHLVGE
jgi:hypothetical protein